MTSPSNDPPRSPAGATTTDEKLVELIVSEMDDALAADFSGEQQTQAKLRARAEAVVRSWRASSSERGGAPSEDRWRDSLTPAERRTVATYLATGVSTVALHDALVKLIAERPASDAPSEADA